LPDEGQAFDEGARNAEDTVMGSYVHGLFDETAALDFFLRWAGGYPDRHGEEAFDYPAYRNAQIDRLADAVEAAIPFATLCRLVSFPEA
jgi:adenosylcobyric acid synthase